MPDPPEVSLTDRIRKLENDVCLLSMAIDACIRMITKVREEAIIILTAIQKINNLKDLNKLIQHLNRKIKVK